MRLQSILQGLIKDEAAKEQVFRVLCRFAAAHICFLFRKSFVFTWVKDIKMYAVHKRHSSTECYYYGYYDPAEMRFLQRYLKKGDLFGDVGANIGSYALLAAACGAKSTAIEPAPSTFALLKENIAVNPLLEGQITPLQCAAGDMCGGMVDFTTELDSENRVISDAEAAGNPAVQKVLCRTLDDIFSDLDVVKIDVENYEIQVLQGAEKLLASKRLNVIIIEAFDCFLEIESILEQYGYSQYCYDYKYNRLSRCSGCKNGNNVLFIKEICQVKERIRSLKFET